MNFFLKEENEEQEDNGQLPGLKEGFIEITQKISTDLIWIRVKNSKFFFLTDGDEKNLGVRCQCNIDSVSEAVNGHDGFESFSLLQKYNRDNKTFWRTLIATTINTKKRYVGEFKQVGNQFVGNQSVYGVSGGKCADLYFSFLENHFPNIGKFSSDLSKLEIPDTVDETWGYASTGLVNLMKKHTERFRIYTERVPDVMLYMENLIINVLGEKFFIPQKSVSEIFHESHEQFFKDIPKFLEFKREELLDFLKQINIMDYFSNKSIRPYIVNNLPVLIEFFDTKNLINLLSSISIKELFYNGVDLFLELTKMLAANGSETKKILFNFIDAKFLDIINSLGGKGIGLGKLITMLKRPKLDVHKDAKLNRETGNFEINRREQGVDVKKTIRDENLIFSNKEIKNLLDKHKDEIQKFFDSPGKNSYLEYLRFLIQHLPEGQSKGQLNSVKDEFIDYYNKKFDDGTSEYPGKMLYDGMMNQLRFKLGEKSRRKSFDLKNIWQLKSLSEFPFTNDFLRIQDMSTQDISDSKYLMYLLKYFYKNLKEKLGKLEYSPEGRPRFINTESSQVKQSLSDFLYITAALNGIGKNEISSWMNKINTNFIKMGQTENNPNKYKIPAPSPKMVDWADKETLYADKQEKLDEMAIRSYIKNKILK